MTYGRDATLPIDLEISVEPLEESHAEGFKEQYFRRLTRLVGKVVDDQQQAHNNIEVAQEKQKKRHDQKIQEKSYAIGQKVLLRNYRARKLDPKWHGPYYIHDFGKNGTYKLRTLDGKLRKKLVHAD